VDFTWSFLQAAVSFPNIGADFIKHYRLIVDLASNIIYAPHLKLKIELSLPPAVGFFSVVLPVGLADQEWPAGPPPAHISVSHPSVPEGGEGGKHPQQTDSIKDLIWEFNELFDSKTKNLPHSRHGVYHRIEMTGRPVKAKYRRLDPDRLKAAKAEFMDLEKQGIIRRSDSCWASPLQMVKKEDGTWRPCGDYRRVNLQTTPNLYTCPNIGDMSAELAGCVVFSKLDLKKGYHQVPVHPADVAKTAVITPFGLFEYVRMPFGMRNAGQTFQRLMERILAGLEFCFVYLDDILVASKDGQEHQRHLHTIFERLQANGLVLNKNKCLFAVQALDFLGHRVSAAGIAPLESRVAALRNFPQPKTIRQLRSFLGMVNFYRRLYLELPEFCGC
jgi:hypothetical protein